MDFARGCASTGSPDAIASASRRIDCQSSCADAIFDLPADAWVCRMGRAPAKPPSSVIPGCAEGAGPESITTIVRMDSGLAPRGAPRNDGGDYGALDGNRKRADISLA